MVSNPEDIAREAFSNAQSGNRSPRFTNVITAPTPQPATGAAAELAARRNLARNGGPPPPPAFRVGQGPLPMQRPYADERDAK